jgi:hypothetical protein
MHPNRVFRLSWLAALVCLASWATPARAQVVTFTAQGVDELVETVKYGLKLAGYEDQATHLDGFIQSFLDGFKGIDTKKPWGSYVTKFPAGEAKPPTVLFVPVTSEEDFYGLLGKLNLNPNKEDGGLRSLDIPTGQRFFARVKDGYAFLSEDADSLKEPLNPATFAKALPRGTLLKLHFDVKQIPAPLKAEAIKKMDEQLAQEREKKEGENEHDHQARLWGIRVAREGFERLIKDSAAFDLALRVDREKHLVLFEASLAAEAGSPLAGEIGDMRKASTQFGGLAESSAAFLFWNGVINEKVRADLNNLLDTAVQKGIEKEPSVLKRAVAEKTFKVLEPTLKSDVIDVALSLRRGPASALTAVAAARVKNGKQIEQLLRDFGEGLKENDKKVVKFDAEKAGDVNIHVVTPPPSDKGAAEMAHVFGEAKIAIAFHNDAVVAAIGKNSIDEVKQVLSGLGRPSPRPASFEIELHAKAFTRFEKNEAKRKAFEDAFSEPGSDLIRLAVTGGDRLEVRVQASTHLLKLARAAQAVAE